MADEDLRRAERSWESTGDVDAGERTLRARLRAGTITQDTVRIAADLGDPVAVRLEPGEWPEDPFPEATFLPAWANAHWGTVALIEAAFAVASFAPTEAVGIQLMLPSLDLPGWIRLQAAAAWVQKAGLPGLPKPTAAHYGPQVPEFEPLARAQAAGLLGCAVRIAAEFGDADDPRAVVRDALIPWLLEGRPAPEPPPQPRFGALRFLLPSQSSPAAQIARHVARGVPTLIPFPNPGGTIRVGRALPDSDYGVTAPGVSRHQCSLECDPDGQIWIVDARSAGGTYVNNQTIARHRAAAGDVLRLGGGPGFLYRVQETSAILDGPPPMQDASEP